MKPSRHFSSLLLLCLALALCAACQDKSPDIGAQPEAPSAATAERADEGALLDALASAHGALHSQDAPAPDGLTEDMAQAIQREAEFRAPLEAFYKEAGPCALACGGDLTDAGRALLRLMALMPEHGVKTERFKLDELNERLASWRQVTGAQGLLSDPATDSADAALLDALRAPRFDRARVRAALSSQEALPPVARVKELEQALAATPAPSDEEVARRQSRRTHRVQARLGRLLLQAVLEMVYARRAGPEEVTEDDQALAEQVQAELVPLMLEVVRSPDPDAALEKLWPEEPEYRKMLVQHRRYLELADKGGCPKLPEGVSFEGEVKPGPEVKLLQERLRCESYLEGQVNGEYDALTREAVKLYQRHHDFTESGEVSKGMVSSLNVSMKKRARQIGLALQRMRDSHLKDMGSYFILVNLPSFQMRVYEDGEVVKRRKIIIGSNKLDDDKYELIQGHINRTPLFQTRLYEVVINPDWLLPPRVYKGEMVGHLEKNPGYLEENNIRKITLANGKDAYVQGVGRGNVLGKVKFLLERSSAIYLHDTNDKTLFRKRQRAFSHGCMRVHEATDFALWLLVHDGQDKDDIERSLEAKKVQRGVKLNKPVPLATVYRTVELSDAGLPIFYSDIYHYDRAYFQNKVPAKQTTRWGDSVLRPHWVPTVSYKQYKGWRDAGKPAPRDLKPEGEDGEKKGKKGKKK